MFTSKASPCSVKSRRGFLQIPKILLSLSMPHDITIGLQTQLVQRASDWVQTLGVGDYVHFRMTNATIALERLLSTYPGPLEVAMIQMPDPQHKTRCGL